MCLLRVFSRRSICKSFNFQTTCCVHFHLYSPDLLFEGLGLRQLQSF